MDKKKVIKKSQKAVVRFFKIRRTIKTFFAFLMGISVGLNGYAALSERFDAPYAVAGAILGGAATTAGLKLLNKIMQKYRKPQKSEVSDCENTDDGTQPDPEKSVDN